MIMAADIKVSVIIPVYNAEKYLRECLDSVIEQTLQEIEIICVDDGSTDNSLAILKEYTQKDERLKIIEQANRGAGAARNMGMAVALGEYLAFLDADDLYYPQALAQAYAAAVKEKADMLAFDAEYFIAGSAWLNPQINSLLLADRQMISAENDGKFLFQLLSCNTWCKLYRRDFVQRSGLRYQEIKTANDLCFVCSALAVAERIAVLDKPLVKHRVLHSGNLQSVKVKTPLDFMAALEQLKQNLQQFGLWEKLRQSYLNCALSHFVYNWQTLDKAGRKQIAAKGGEIAEFLELAEHSADYYYSQNDYMLMCRVVRFNREGDLRFMGKLKNMLKHILPPPVKAFNREVAGMKQMMLELNSGLMAQQRQFSEEYAEQLGVLEERQKEQLAYIEKQQRLLADKIQRNEELLNKIAHNNADIESGLTDLTNKQNEFSGRAGRLVEKLGRDAEERWLKAAGWGETVNGFLRQINAGNDELKKLAGQNRQKAQENSRYAAEAVWAAIFNNTIVNSQWLVDKTFAPGRWAVGYPYLYVMYRVLNEARPKKILELGLGQSTRMIGQYAAAYSEVEHIVVEHDLEWISFFENDFHLSNHSRIVQLEREMVAYKETAAVRVFSDFKERFVGQKFDFISIDAPFGGDMKQYARIDVLSMLPDCLSDDFVIMLDDCERSGEPHTLAEMERVLQENEIKYKCGRYSGKKDCVLICAAHLGFLSSM